MGIPILSTERPARCELDMERAATSAATQAGHAQSRNRNRALAAARTVACRSAERLAVAVGAVLLIAAIGAATATAAGVERTLELVSPAGIDTDATPGVGIAAPGGDFVCWHSQKGHLGAVTVGLVLSHVGYCSRRTETGWESEWATGPAPLSGEPQGVMGALIYFVSPDGRRIVFNSDNGIFPDPLNTPTGLPGFGNLSAYIREDGVTSWLAPAPDPPVDETTVNGTITSGREPLAVSDDLRHGLFVSLGRLVPEDVNDVMDVYKWTPDGVRLVSTGTVPSGGGRNAWPPTARTDLLPHRARAGAISSDGSRAFFLHRGSSLDGEPASDFWTVYRREGAEIELASPRRGPGPEADIWFAGATPDGSTVYLSTQEQLTSEPKAAGDALYRYDIETDDLSLVATHADGIAPLAMSRDGSTLVYTTNADMPPLMVYRDGASTTIPGTAMKALDGDMLIGGFFVPGVLGHRLDRSGLRVSDDGRVVVFASGGMFAGALPGTTRVYRWEEGEGVAVVSVTAGGQPSPSQATIGNYSVLNPTAPVRSSIGLVSMRGNASDGRAISADGSRVFFETAAALVPEDINGVYDVYEWEDGEVRLISPGTQRDNALYHDNSADGSTVFFTTTSRLIPELDRNASNDLYAARVGGGFPLPELATECAGDDCQAPAPADPPAAVPGSSSFKGAADLDPARGARPTLAVALGRRTAGPVRRLRVRVPGAGRIFVSGAAVRRASRRVGATATYTMRVRLSARARRALRRKGHVRVRVRVAFRARTGGVAFKRLGVSYKQARQPKRGGRR